MKQYLPLALLIMLFAFQPATAQNVGIGTTIPTRAKLEVHGAVGLTSAIFGGEGQGVSIIRDIPGIGFNTYFDNVPRLMKDGTGAFQYFHPGTGSLNFEISLSGYADVTPPFHKVMSMFYDGTVYIGSLGNKPAATLFVDRGTGVDGTAVFAGTQHRSHFNYSYDQNTYIRAGKDNGMVYINDIPGSKVAIGGFVGINTANPYYPLEIWQPTDKGLDIVNGNTNDDWEFRVTGGQGWLQLYRNTTFVGRFQQWGDYSSVSDRRLKKDIKAMPSVLDKVMQLAPVNYKFTINNPGNEQTLGFIAQDVKPLFPELVSVAADSSSGIKGLNEVHTLNYSGFSVVAIKAIQEQQQQIEKLERELKELRSMLNEWKNQRQQGYTLLTGNK